MRAPSLQRGKEIDLSNDLTSPLPAVDLSTEKSQTPLPQVEKEISLAATTSLNIELSSNLREHSEVQTTQSKQPIREVSRSRDIVSRFVTWLANLIKALERRLLKALERLPIIRVVIAKKDRKSSLEEELTN